MFLVNVYSLIISGNTANNRITIIKHIITEDSDL